MDRRFLPLLLVFIVLFTRTRAEDKLKISPPQASYQVDHTASVSCVSSDPLLLPLNWRLPNGAELRSNERCVNGTCSNQTYVYDNRTTFDAIGHLKILNLTLNDTGKYTCLSFDGAFNATQDIKVYIMPDYFVETVVLLAINAALLIIFILCSVYTLVKNRRDNEKQSKRMN